MHISIGDEDIGAALRLVNERLDHWARTLTRIERKQEYTMALVSIEQGDLDAIATTVLQVADTLQAVLDSETPLSPADESGVQDALIKLRSVGPRVPANAPAAPVDETPAPQADPAPADGTGGDGSGSTTDPTPVETSTSDTSGESSGPASGGSFGGF